MRYLDVRTYHDTEIVSTADLKEHLRITFSDDDDYIDSFESAAVRRLEDFTNLFLLETNLNQFGNTFEDLNILYKSPMLSETPTIQYIKDGAFVTLAASNYEVIAAIKPPRIYASNSGTIPTADDVFQAWKISYTVGYASASAIPAPLIQAIKIMVADMYENRQSVIVGKIVSEIPKTAEYLMMPYKVQTL